MGFKELTSLDADVVIALGGKNRETGKKNPTEAEGYYLGSRKVESKKSKSGFSYIHFLQTVAGNLGVWGKTDLDRKIAQVTPGTMVRITQTGMTPTPNGDMYKYKVEQDTESTIEVNLSEATPTEGVEEEVQEEEQEQEEDTALAAQQAAARKAKVEALLNKGKTKTK